MTCGSFRRECPRRPSVFDLILTIPGLIVISPVLALIALFIRIRLGRPVFFRQVRPGLRGEPFLVYKFRTMSDLRTADGRLLPDQVRLTGSGEVSAVVQSG